MKLNKTKVVFGIVTVYIVAAFGWWTYAHIRSSTKLLEKEVEELDLLCYKATLDINGAISEEMIEDSTRARSYLKFNYPQLEIVFDETLPPLENFLIRPTRAAYSELRDKQNRTERMYKLEGVVMIGLLFWGIIWIFSNLQNKLKLKRQQGNFMLSITHELKTPLASIKLYLETLQKRELTKEQSKTIIANSMSDVFRLRDLVENILLAAQLDAHKYELQLYETNLSDVVSKSVERFVHPRNIQDRVNIHIEKDVFLYTDEAAIEMVLNNLLSNALKYSPPTGRIDVFLQAKTNQIILSVGDEGQGISSQNKESIFEKFYRTGDELTRKTKGTGLGLYIIKNLMYLLNGEIVVKNKNPKGTIFELIFKKDA